MRLAAMVLALAVPVCGAAAWAQGTAEQAHQRVTKKAETFDGNWWSAAAPDERSGFLEGTADCLTWIVHAQDFSGMPYRLTDEITRYYKMHPKQRRLAVPEVWRRVAAASKPVAPPPDAEIWDNPHWYLNGLWWGNCSEAMRSGFVEGFLWCLRTRVNGQKNAYPRTIAYYVRRIDEYLKAHPKADDKAVANILKRFRARAK